MSSTNTSSGQAGWSSAFQQTRSTKVVKKGNVASPYFSCQRITIPGYCSYWYEALKDRLDELTSLPVGWDGYAGQPVSFQSAKFVADMLERLCREGVPPPYLVPGSDGSVQVEWHRNQVDVELDVLGPQNIEATRYNRESGEEQVIHVENNFTEIAAWLDDLMDATAQAIGY